MIITSGGEGRANGTAHSKEPAACTPEELGEFARLVRQGFVTADERLEARVQAANRLAFYYGAGDALAAIAALKAPPDRFRGEVFSKAGALANPADYFLELGWVFAIPDHRKNGIARGLCQELLAHVPTSSVFATTRTDNSSMTRILIALGFVRTGHPYSRGSEKLVLLLRPGPDQKKASEYPA